ncbi:polysaccharide export protein [bacterium]|nr:polysaccharide export protein [bacterium]
MNDAEDSSLSDSSNITQPNSPLTDNEVAASKVLLPDKSKIYNEQNNCYQMEYLLGPEDSLTIVVTGQNEYQIVKDVVISIDGTFIFDFFGEVKAAGLSTQQLEKVIQSSLSKDFLVDPRVSVSIKDYQSHKIYISGQVNQPGKYIIKRQCALLSEIILEAGGLHGNFRKDAFIIRANNENENPNIEMIDLYQLLIEGDRVLNIPVYDKDIIQVFDKGENVFGPQNSIFIFGEIEKPGMYPFSDDLTVLSAILINGGGFTKVAKKSKVVVKREINDKIESIMINLDDVMQGKKDIDISLKPGDIIQVPRTFF